MELSERDKKAFVRRLLLSRMRLLSTHGFYGILLMHMGFRLSEAVETAATDGKDLYFAPAFLAELSDGELDFVLLHEVLHAALQHCTREGKRDHERFNIACDIVVNSTILLENHMDPKSISIAKFGGESRHLAPDGEEGHKYSAEQVYEMLGDPSCTGKTCYGNGNAPRSRKGKVGSYRDDHSLWTTEEDSELRETWTARVIQAAQAVEIRDPSHSRGLLPGFAQRLLKELRTPRVDWRTILSEFVQPEVNDYSFSPPDRRFFDSPFFLPDYNEMGEGDEVHDILFMVDTSGSVSDGQLAEALGEIKGAIEQFNGRLRGWLGYFDAEVIPPKAFEDTDSMLKIPPYGGGGTDFACIFAYVRLHMADKPPAYIVILTDGYAPFPPESAPRGIPVLWLLNNHIVEPPWGKVAYME